jgi:hypothetical protein
LGGNRKGLFRTNLNLLITMLLGGLWHGAHLRFIIWGGLHGLALLMHKSMRRFFPLRKEGKSRFRRFVGIAVTFHFVAFCWIFFRAGDMQSALEIIRRVASPTPFSLIGEIVAGYRKFFIVLTAGFFLHWLPLQFKEQLRGQYIRLSMPVKMALAVLLFFFIYQMKSSVLQPFVYFQF